MKNSANVLKKNKASLLVFFAFISMMIFSSNASAVSGVACDPGARSIIQERAQEASEVDAERRKAYEEQIEESTMGQIWEELKSCASLPSLPSGPRFPSLTGILDGLKNKACSIVRNTSNEQITNRTRGIFDVDIPQLPDEVRGITGNGSYGIGDAGKERDEVQKEISDAIENVKNGYGQARNQF